MKRSYIKLGAMIVLGSLALSGCKGEAPFSSPESRMAKAISTFEISGHAVDGLIANGSVSVYDFKEGTKGRVIGSGMTDEFGAFTSSIQGVSETEPQFVMACVESGTYTEEASGAEIALQDGDELCAVKLFNPENDFSVVINPWSHYAAASALYKISQGDDVITAVDSANTSISTVYGFDILDTIPRDLTDIGQSGQPYDDAMKMGSSIAGISQFVLNAANGVGVETHTNDFSSIKLHATIFNDIMTDGKLDGLGMANDGVSSTTLGMGNELFDRETYSKDFALANIEFIRSDKNATDVEASMILSEQSRIASSTNTIFPALVEGEILPSLDSVGPVVGFVLGENTYVSDLLDVVGTAKDFSEIKALKLSINGVDTDLTPSENFTYSLNTTLINDGPLEVIVTATDLLNNESQTSLNVIVSNNTPISNITSPLLVNQASYNFTALLESYPQGVDSIEVNGVVAALDENGLVTATITLDQGVNPISMSVFDSIGQKFDYSFSVNSDKTAPTLLGTYPGDHTYSVLYSDPLQLEPVTDIFAMAENEKALYIDQFHTSLNGTAVETANLKSQSWAFIEFSVSDPATPTGDVKTNSNDLVVSYTYSQDSIDVTERFLTSEDSSYLIPLATEFLVADWASFIGSHEIMVTIKDTAGNIYSVNYYFTTHNSAPALTTEVDISTVLAGKEAVIDFDSTDFTGADTVVLTVDGVEYTSTNVLNPTFTIDTTILDGGGNFGTVKAYKDGVEIFEQRVDFTVSNGSAEILITSADHTNQPFYNLAGTATNAVGIDYVNVDGDNAGYQFLDNSWGASFTGLTNGVYTTVISAATVAGDVASVTFQFIVDLVTPTQTTQYPNVATGYQVQLKDSDDNEPTVQDFVFSTVGDKIYVDQFHVELGAEVLTAANLTAKGFPFFKFTPVDPEAGADNVHTPQDQLVVEYTYKQNGGLIKSGTLAISDETEGSYIFPITEEMLDADWADFTGTHLVEITTTDLAGNELVTSFDFKTHKAVPAATTTVVASTWFGGTTKQINFTSVDFTGFDEAIFTVGGVDYTSAQLTDPSFTINPAVLTEGSATGVLKTTNNGTDEFTQDLTFRVDNTAPVITGLTYPALTNQLSASVAGNVIESASGVDTLLVNASSTAVSGNAFSAIASLASEGTNVLPLVITDNVGNQSSVNATIVRDTVAPSLAVTPSSTLTKEMNVNLDVVTSDVTTSVASLSGSVSALSPAENTSYSVNLVLEGANTLTVIATDEAGNAATVTKSVVRDTAAPSLTLTAAASLTNQLNVNLTVATTDVTTSVATLSGDVTASSPAASSVHNVSLGSEGNNILSVTATDMAGNAITETEMVVRDTVAPALSVSTGSSITKNSSVSVTVATSDVTTSVVSLSGSVTEANPVASASYTVSLPGQGSQVITVNATDLAGNINTKSVNVTRDSVAPGLTLTPNVTQTKNSTVSLTVAANDATTSVASLSGAVTATNPEATSSYTLNLSNEGTNSFSVTATDDAGNVTTKTTSVIRDTVSPLLSLTPAATITSASSVNVTAATSDATTGVVSLSGSILQSNPVASKSYSVALSAEGPKTISVTATDAVGNAKTTTTTVTRDSSGPSLTITPSTTITKDATVNLTVNTYDSYTSVVNLSGSVSASNPAAITGHTVSIGSQGNNTISVTATDSAGNATTKTTTVVRDNGAPTFSLSGCTGIINYSSCSINLVNPQDAHTNLDKLQWYVNGVANGGVINSNFSGSKLLLGLMDGPNNITARLTDGVGNYDEKTQTITIDTQEPILSVNPVSTLFNPNSYTMSGTCYDISKNSYASGLSSLTIQGSTVTCLDGTWSKSVSGWVHGENAITAVLTDQVGNSKTVITTVNVVIDLQGPVITNPLIVDTADNQGESSRRVISYIVNVTDNYTNISDVSIASYSDKAFFHEVSGSSADMGEGIDLLSDTWDDLCTIAKVNDTTWRINCSNDATDNLFSSLVTPVGTNYVIENECARRFYSRSLSLTATDSLGNTSNTDMTLAIGVNPNSGNSTYLGNNCPSSVHQF